MSIDFSNDDFKKNIHQFYKKVSQELKSNFDRNLSFQDAVFDRWERAKELNFGTNTSIYNSSSVFGNVKVGENSWIGPNTLLDGTGGELIIGNNCSISSGVQIFSRSQDLPDGFRRLLKKSKNSRISTGDKKLTFLSQWVFCKYEIIFFIKYIFCKN